MSISPIDSTKTAEDILKELKNPLLSVSPKVTISEALSLMVKKKAGAVVIMEEEKVVGIWTERDLIRNTLEDGFDPQNVIIGNKMNKKLHFFAHDTTSDKMIDKCLGLHFRHLLIEKHGKFIGLLSLRDILRNFLRERAQMMEKEENQLKWDYYEEWRFKPE